MADAAADAYQAAAMEAKDFDVALLHDAFTISVLITLEALQFCAPGRAGDYLRQGHASMGGRCPLNPHGGLLSQAHIGGMLHITEAVHQLRGTAGPRQIPGARRAVLSGNGGVFSVCGVMVLEAQ
jgi:acetyl-CoA acetyltransferase